MPVLKADRLPKYRKHKASGQAIVTLAGRDHYLGPHGTQASRVEYDRLISQWLANGRPTREKHDKEITVTQLLALFWEHAQTYYVKNGKPTSTAGNYKIAIKLFRSEFGELRVNDLGPLGLAHLPSGVCTIVEYNVSVDLRIVVVSKISAIHQFRLRALRHQQDDSCRKSTGQRMRTIKSWRHVATDHKAGVRV